MGDDLAAVLADRPQPTPKRKRYPSDTKTPAVACRLDRADYETLKSIANATSLPLATVVKVILLDWLDKHEANGEREIKRLVTRSINGP